MSMNKQRFLKAAKPVQVTINGVPMLATPMKFSSGGVGYNINGKMEMTIDGEVVRFQVGMNLSAVKSKEWAEDGAAVAVTA